MNSVFLHVTAGNGPAECRIALADLLDRIREEAAARGLSIDIARGRDPDGHGPMSAAVSVHGDEADSLARSYVGSIQYVFKSPVRPGHQRQNWFVGVSLAGDPSETKAPDVDPRDVRIDTMRAGGAGGQHVNTTDSAVRATHIPTGIVAISRDERSQHRNRATALRRLAGLLEIVACQETERRKRDVFQANKELERGNPVMKLKLRRTLQ